MHRHKRSHSRGIRLPGMTWLQARVSWQQVTKPGIGTPLSGGALHLVRPPRQEAEASPSSRKGTSLPGVRLQRCEQAVEKGEGARLGMACTHAEGSAQSGPAQSKHAPRPRAAPAACLQPACTRLARAAASWRSKGGRGRGGSPGSTTRKLASLLTNGSRTAAASTPPPGAPAQARHKAVATSALRPTHPQAGAQTEALGTRE